MSTVSDLHLHSHFGVYAVIVQAGSMLLIQKVRGPYLGRLDLPGGSPEPEELLEDTLSREVHEETGCTLADYRQIGAVSAHFDYQMKGRPARLRHLGVLYRCVINGEPKKTGDGEDSAGCVWQPIGAIQSDVVTPFVAQALKLLRGGNL